MAEQKRADYTAQERAVREAEDGSGVTGGQFVASKTRQILFINGHRHLVRLARGLRRHLHR